MAMEVNQTFFAWSQGESTERDGSQGVSVSQTLDHGSVSFGRFELESLSWEKWSVFTNDRRNEEFGKFNGLVAQKKAYFEEYYKRIRELKASQQQNQQTELTLEYSGDGSDSSQTVEDEQAADLETPTGSGTIVDDYMEGAAQESTSEHGPQCCDDRQNENFNAEFSASSISMSAGALQQIDQDTRGTVSGDNSASKMNVEKKNARTPRRIVEKDSGLRPTPKIIPRSVQSLSKSALDYTFARERPGSVKPSTSMNQKAKPGIVHPFQRPNATAQKMAGPAEKSKATCLRRPSSAGAQRPSTGERKPIVRESSKKPPDVSTLRRPSTAERRPITRDRAQQQAIGSTPRRPSTSERHPVKRENASKPAVVSTIRRPSTGERHTINRESVLRTDVKTPSKPRAAMAHLKSNTPTAGNLKMAITPSPNAARSSKLETRSNTNRLKGPSALDSSFTRPKRMDMPVSVKQKSSSVNLPPRKTSSYNIGETAVVARPKKKEGMQATRQSRSSTLKKSTPLQTGNVNDRAPNPPPPPPPPRRSSRMTSKPNASNSSSIGGRKPKASAPQWH